MFDELSAMSRTVYDNFTDLIRYGVVEKDTHPAGVQVFMFYWVRLFGEREVVVKLPFMLAGLASVYLAYLIGRLWFNTTTGMLTAAYISSLQFFVMYSQIARPYASGLFLTLMMVLFWSKYFFEKNKIIYLVWFVFFAALSAYNHYFSLLFAAIVGFSGLFFVKKETIVPYLISGAAIVLLFVPHLEIFFSQLKKGGVGGWLAKPEVWFPVQFFNYLFHFSFWVYGTFLLVFIAGLFLNRGKLQTDFYFKKRVVLLVWFFLPLIIGYIYSLKVEPILQYSLLLFSTPYFLILAFSFVKELNFTKLSFAVSMILLVNILSLVFIRQHYRVLYSQPSDEIVKKAVELEKEYPGNVFMITNTISYYNEYYFRKYKKVIPYYTVRNKELGPFDFEKMISEIREEVVITADVDANAFQVVNKYFPHWIAEQKGFTFENYIFSKTNPKDENVLKRKLVAYTDFKNSTGNWDIKKENVATDSLTNEKLYEVSSVNEWSLGGLFPFSDYTSSIDVIYDIEAELLMENMEDDALLVASLVKDGKSIGFSAVNLQSQLPDSNLNRKLALSVDVQLLLSDKSEIDNVQLKAFIWNKEFKHFYIRNYSVSLREGNPCRYGLYYDFQD